MRDATSQAIEAAVDALVPLRRAGEKLDRELSGQVRNVMNAAGGPEKFIAWVNHDFNWRFNVAEAPSELRGRHAELADYVIRSILEELLDKQMASDKKSQPTTRR